ncbi:MAG: hypothetical protein HY074_07720, partial [Deltaproteobacteria bacterium]|nr:hypothetical protein [Deltaproteobacteria bacterium]
MIYLFVLPTAALAQVRDGETAIPACSRGSFLVRGGVDGGSGCGRGPDGAIRVGHWVWRDDAGKVLYELSYDEQGREDGKASSFGADGRLVLEQHFVHGQLEGLETRWWPESGHLREQKMYRGGKIHGIRKRWAYEPGIRKDCSSENGACWVGSQECWVD